MAYSNLNNVQFDRTDIILISLLIGFLLLIAVIEIYKYLEFYRENRKIIKIEMQRANSFEDYMHWKRELTVLRWSVLPWVNPEKVKMRMREKERRRNKRR